MRYWYDNFKKQGDRLSVTDSHKAAMRGLFKPSGQCLAEGNYMDSRSWGNAARHASQDCASFTQVWSKIKMKGLIKTGVGGSRV